MTPVLTASDYIRDGLIFQLDGIEKGNQEGYWLDLIGGDVYDISTNQLTNNSVNTPPAINLLTQKGDSNSTVEICTSKIYNNSTNRGIFINAFSGICLRKFGRFSFIRQLSSGVTENNVADSVDGSQCHSLSKNYVIEDGIKIPVDRHLDWNQTVIVRIGGGTGYLYSGNIYSLRVYDRQLTDDEILYNQRVDNVRFNLGLNLNGGIQPYTPGRELTMSRNLALDEASPLESFDESLSTEEEECVNVTER